MQSIPRPLEQGMRLLCQEDLIARVLELEDEVAALSEDNKQLRAAVQIFSEVARRSPGILPIQHRRVA